MTQPVSLGTDLVAALQQGTVTSAELVEDCLAQIERLDDHLRVFVTPTPDQAREAAAAADAALAAGRLLGPLHGLPVGVKDNIATEGVRTTMGSTFFGDNVPETDAEVWRRLLIAGAVLVGKTQLHEFAFGATTQNPHYGACRNPWGPDRTPGGSSGGSGAAVAAGMAAASLGTDTGGSVRIPASLNGLTGIRPSTGGVPNSGVHYVGWSFDTVGPLARSVGDVAALHAVMEGFHAPDPMSATATRNPQSGVARESLDGVRVGLPSAFFFDGVDQPIVDAVRAAAEVLNDLGADLADVSLDGAEEANEACTRIIWAEARAQHEERFAANPELFGEDLQRRLLLADQVSGAEYGRFRQLGRFWTREVEQVLESVDVILTPTNGVVAPPADGEMIETTVRLVRLTYGWSLARIPALSLPCGFSPEGLPIGVQLAGPRWSEPLLFEIGRHYQRATDWHRQTPPLVADDGSGRAAS